MSKKEKEWRRAHRLSPAVEVFRTLLVQGVPERPLMNMGIVLDGFSIIPDLVFPKSEVAVFLRDKKLESTLLKHDGDLRRRLRHSKQSWLVKRFTYDSPLTKSRLFEIVNEILLTVQSLNEVRGIKIEWR